MTLKLQDWIAFQVNSVDHVVFARRVEAHPLNVRYYGHDEAIMDLDLLHKFILANSVVQLVKTIGIVNGAGHEVVSCPLVRYGSHRAFMTCHGL